MTPFRRILLAYGITDEIFGVAVDKKARYRRPILLRPDCSSCNRLGYGTLAGALLGGIFPSIVTSALAIGIYGMFVSIVLPSPEGSCNHAQFSGRMPYVFAVLLRSCSLSI